MTITNALKYKLAKHDNTRSFWESLHIDGPLLFALFFLIMLGLLILYSASGQNFNVIEQQGTRIGFSLLVMIFFAQIPPLTYQRWAPWAFLIGIVLLFAVMGVGQFHKGGQRWLNFGIFRFQPSEMMKLAIPMYLAAHFHKIHLPLKFRSVIFATIIILIPAVLTAKQPDLGTGILLAIGGFSVVFLAGLSFRLMISLGILATFLTPILWHFMHDYQRQRILTFLNPDRDPLGNGYHIIQSKIAIGSGGLFGKGWLNGTQSHLNFLPEHSTDFIFAVCAEEFGFMGTVILILLFMSIVIRGLYITIRAQDTFSRLLAGSLTLTFFCSFFINIGMVTGILPVVGLPLPLVSYGGSSMVTLMASFGILMSIQTHRKLLTT